MAGRNGKPRLVARVRLVLTNPKSMRALACVCEVLDEAAEDLPWRDDLKRGVKACKYLLRHMGCISVESEEKRKE